MSFQDARAVWDTFLVLINSPDSYAPLSTYLLQCVTKTNIERLALLLQSKTWRTLRQLLAHILGLIGSSPTDTELCILGLSLKKILSPSVQDMVTASAFSTPMQKIAAVAERIINISFSSFCLHFNFYLCNNFFTSGTPTPIPVSLQFSHSYFLRYFCSSYVSKDGSLYQNGRDGGVAVFHVTIICLR